MSGVACDAVRTEISPDRRLTIHLGEAAERRHSLTYRWATLGGAMWSGSMERAEYKLVVRGELDARFAYLFNGMRMERTKGTTVIAGPVVDQAQLHGFIERIEELGLELVAVEQISEPGRPSTERGTE